MGHWYTKSGEAMHYFTDKNGEQKPTTLREARKLELYPSVTTILREADKGPILQDWITDQAILSALRHPGGVPKFDQALLNDSKHDSVKSFLEWCRADSRKLVADKAELGVAIHDAINKSYVDPDEVPAHFLAHIDGVRNKLGAEFGEERVWLPERTHTNTELGVGGGIDLESEEPYGDCEDGLLIDTKCKEFEPDKRDSSLVFDEHLMQLGGYSLLRKRKPRCGNLFVSTSNPGLVRLVMHKPEDIERGQAMFLALLTFWRARNKYFP